MLDEKNKDHRDVQKDDPGIHVDLLLTLGTSVTLLLINNQTLIIAHRFAVIKTDLGEVRANPSPVSPMGEKPKPSYTHTHIWKLNNPHHTEKKSTLCHLL